MVSRKLCAAGMLCWHKAGEGGCSAPCSRTFINEGIRDEGNLLPKKGHGGKKNVLSSLSAAIRQRQVCTGSG